MAAFEAALKPFMSDLDDAEDRVRKMLEAKNRKEQERAG
jgi:hypothetical protein